MANFHTGNVSYIGNEDGVDGYSEVDSGQVYIVDNVDTVDYTLIAGCFEKDIVLNIKVIQKNYAKVRVVVAYFIHLDRLYFIVIYYEEMAIDDDDGDKVVFLKVNDYKSEEGTIVEKKKTD